MNRGSATIAIVAARIRKEARIMLFCAAACALLAYLQRYDDAQAQFAGILIFASLLGITISLVQRGAGRFRQLDLCELSAPLYGRELARATALVPCIVVSAALASYWIVLAVFSHPSAGYALACAAGVYAATLVALSATVRTGATRTLYVVLAFAVTGVTYALASKTPIASAIGVCFLAGFVALRGYGEALARYDPVPPDLHGLS